MPDRRLTPAADIRARIHVDPDRWPSSIVGWVERSETHRAVQPKAMGFALLSPSYVLETARGFAGKKEWHRARPKKAAGFRSRM
jgi:hypothetical protein